MSDLGSRTFARMPPGLRARAISWPLTFVGPYLQTVQGVARMRQALWHLTWTPLGAYRVDPEYGTLWRALRTQAMTVPSGSGREPSAMGGGLVDSVVSHHKSQVARYCPGVMLHSVSILPVAEKLGGPPKLRVDQVWTVESMLGQGAAGGVPGAGGIGEPMLVTM